MEKHTDASAEPCHLTALPPELRTQIWQDLLIHDRATAEDPRHRQILSTCNFIHTEAMGEINLWDEVQFTIRGTLIDTKARLTLTIGPNVWFDISFGLEKDNDFVPAYEIFRNLPGGLDEIRRINLRIEIPFVETSRSAILRFQAWEVLEALTSAFNCQEYVELNFDDSFLRNVGYADSTINGMRDRLSELRPLMPNPNPTAKSSHFYPKTTGVCDLFRELFALEKEAQDLIDLLKRTGVKPDGLRSVEHAVERARAIMSGQGRGTTEVQMRIRLGYLDAVENALDWAPVRQFKVEAERIEKSEAMEM